MNNNGNDSPSEPDIDGDEETDPPTDLMLTTESGDKIDATPLARLVDSRVESILVHHRGPLPPPEQLRAYDEVRPGLADRIVSMAEREQQHRHTMQAESIRGGLNLSRRGQHYGLGIALTVLVAAVILVLTGHEAAGIVIASVDLVSLAAVFVFGRSGAAKVERNRHRDEP